jgi:hypothetical protein
MTLGGPVPPGRVWLNAEPDRESYLLNQRGELRVTVWSPAARDATVIARFDGEESRTVVHLAAAATTALTLPLRTQTPGERRVDLSLEGLPSGVAPPPCRVIYEVLPRRIKVLIVSGRPSWDTKFLAQALRLDERLEVVSVAALMPGRVETISTRSEVSTPPESPQDLAAFDVAIIGRNPERALPRAALASLVDFADGGGHLVLLDAPAFEDESLRAAWAAADPVVPGEAVVPDARLRASASSPLFKGIVADGEVEKNLSRLPGLAVEGVTALKPATRMLLETRMGEPAVVAMTFGRGRVVAVLARDLWRWRLLPPGSKGLAGIYDGFWSNLVRWLALGEGFAPGRVVSLELSARRIRPGEPVTIEAVARWLPTPWFQPRVSVVDERGGAAAVALAPADSDTRWRGSFVPQSEGTYRVILDPAPLTGGTVEKDFRAATEDVERWNTSADPATMRALAEQTGGIVLDASKPDDAPGLLAAARPRTASTTRIEPAWDRAWVLAVLAGLLGVEWLGRRWVGWS